MNKYPVEPIPHRPEGDTFEIQSSLVGLRYAVINHKWLVFTVCLSTVLLVMTYVKLWPATYQAEVVITADAEDDLQRAAFYQQWNIFRRYSLSDEAQLMTSGPVLKQVIEKLDLKYYEVYHPFTSYAVHLWGESWIGSSYRKLKYMIFPKPTSPFDVPEEEKARAEVLKDFRAGVSVQQVGDTNIGLLVVRGSTPRAAEIANTIVDTYFEERKKQFANEAAKAEESLLIETKKAEAELSAVEQKIKEFYLSNGMYLNNERDRAQLTQWNELNATIGDLRSHVAQLTSTLKVVEEQLKNEDRQIVSARVMKDNVLVDQIMQLEFALQEAKKSFRPGSPEIKALEDKILSAKEVIAKQGAEVESSKTVVINSFYESLRGKRAQLLADLAGASAALKVKEDLAGRMDQQLSLGPEKQQMSISLEREQRLTENKYKVLKEKLVQAAVSKATAMSGPSTMRVIEYASAPEKAIWPKTKLMFIAAVLVGLMCGVVCALLLDLIFLRVNRYKLISSYSEHELYGTVNQDEEFVQQLFPFKEEPKALRYEAMD